MNAKCMNAVSAEEEDLRRDDGLDLMRRLLAAQPERFCLRAEPAVFPPRIRKDHRKKQPEALRAAAAGGPFPSRLPWDLLPAKQAERVRTRVVCQILPAGDLVSRVRTHMKESRLTMEEMAAFLHVSPGTFRKWLRSPEDMTVRDYGQLAAWVSQQTAMSVWRRMPG